MTSDGFGMKLKTISIHVKTMRARKSDRGGGGRQRTASIKLDEDRCKWTRIQRNPPPPDVRLHACTLTLQHWAMCVSSYGEEAHIASTWSGLEYTPSPSCVHPPVTDTNLSFLCFTSLPRCAGEGRLMSSSEGLREWYGGWGGSGCGSGQLQADIKDAQMAQLLSDMRNG